MFEYLEHSSDIKIKVKAKTELTLFKDITKSVNDSLFYLFKSKDIKEKRLKVIKLKNKDYSQLIRDYIDELLYLGNEKHFASKLIGLNITKVKEYFVLCAELELTKVLSKNYKTEIKAVSFNVIYKQNEKTKERICEFILDV